MMATQGQRQSKEAELLHMCSPHPHPKKSPRPIKEAGFGNTLWPIRITCGDAGSERIQRGRAAVLRRMVRGLR